MIEITEGISALRHGLLSKPMHNLIIQLTTFNENMKTLQGSDICQNGRIDHHDDKLSDHKKLITSLKLRAL